MLKTFDFIYYCNEHSNSNTVKMENKTTLAIDGMEIQAFIAGVNSGMYQLPFCIEVRTWAKKWFFTKFFYRSMKLNLYQCKMLRDELTKVIDFNEKK